MKKLKRGLPHFRFLRWKDDTLGHEVSRNRTKMGQAPFQLVNRSVTLSERIVSSVFSRRTDRASESACRNGVSRESLPQNARVQASGRMMNWDPLSSLGACARIAVGAHGDAAAVLESIVNRRSDGALIDGTPVRSIETRRQAWPISSDGPVGDSSHAPPANYVTAIAIAAHHPRLSLTTSILPSGTARRDWPRR